MCSTDRPPDYVIPGGYEPDEMELWRMQQEQEGMLQYQQVTASAVGGSAWGGAGPALCWKGAGNRGNVWWVGLEGSLKVVEPWDGWVGKVL